jgi:hypothetical protein
MVFGLLTNAIENGLDILDGLVDGEMPTKRQIAKLVDAGVTLYAISEATGLAVETLEAIQAGD